MNIKMTIVRMYLFVAQVRRLFAHPHLKSLARILLLDCRVDFRDVSAGELDDNGFSLAGFIRRHEYFHARSFGFRKRVR
jgi:hypothetical protein